MFRSLHTRVMLAAVIGASLMAVPAVAQVPSFQLPPLQPPTYAASISALAIPQTGAMDAVCLVGSASKLVKLKSVSVNGIKTTAQSAVVNLTLRSAASTGGTSTTPAISPVDPANANAATAVFRAYTVASTPGTAVGAIKVGVIGFSAGTVATPNLLSWTFPPDYLVQEPRLRGVASQVCVNFPNAFTTDGPALNVDMTWTEQ